MQEKRFNVNYYLVVDGLSFFLIPGRRSFVRAGSRYPDLWEVHSVPRVPKLRAKGPDSLEVVPDSWKISDLSEHLVTCHQGGGVQDKDHRGSKGTINGGKC